MTRPDQSERKATFGDKLDALIGVVGHRMPASHVTGVYLAEQLGITPPQFTRKRKGHTPVNERELSIIIDVFKVGAQVDFRIFHEPDVDSFLLRLKEAGVGTYGASQRYSLCQLLYNSSRRSGHSVRFSRVVAPPARRGPLGLREDADDGRPVLRIGGRVNIECAGPEGRNLIVVTTTLVSASREPEISVLMPSLFAPETRIEGRTVVLPTARDFEAFDVTSDPGDHRLYAAWADDQVVERIRENLDPLYGVKNMDDRTAGAVAALISAVPGERRAVAACDYVVER